MSELPTVVAGPLLRRAQSNRLVLWLVTSKAVELEVKLKTPSKLHVFDHLFLSDCVQKIEISKKCFCYLIDIDTTFDLPLDQKIFYDILLREPRNESQPWVAVTEMDNALTYPGEEMIGFVIHSRIKKVLHGSCRKPHFHSYDALVRADSYFETHQNSPDKLPSVLIMSGDQVYCDDVSGPMLSAIHQLIKKLDFANEELPGKANFSCDDIYHENSHMYKRFELLPYAKLPQGIFDRFFSGARQPVFTSVHANNHLMTLGEVLAMYLLTWSPISWKNISLDPPQYLANNWHAKYQHERKAIENFRDSLSSVRRLLAHVPVAMIFDDHDVTDDWNLTAGWEMAAYGNPLSKRIIGNALLGYWLFQGWGNAPEQFSSEFVRNIQIALSEPGQEQHNKTIDKLLDYSQWHYEWPTSPSLMVLDTRTQRWRSEKNVHLPSGLMDWESLTELQQKLIGLDSVIIVSAAPIFGVKLIETIQRVVTFFGKPLMVDAENWMAHSGSAHTLLNMFRHSKTPQAYTILSGDVHYSFVYNIELRHRKTSPEIWQITSSGIRNQFPERLLKIFDLLNRWLYAPRSPLNWFTKRRRMRVTPHSPSPSQGKNHLVNASTIGMIDFCEQGKPVNVIQLCADNTDITFNMNESQARWE
ncbi:MAG: alkaline phosphatase D family protein [Pseudomonadota bacterium]